MLLRDGILFFAMLTTLNALEIVLYLTAARDYINYFIAPISTVLVSRFILNLRECAAVTIVRLDSQEISEIMAAEEPASRTLTFAFSPITRTSLMITIQCPQLEPILTTSHRSGRSGM
ncbi:uncharacterized protein B0H18DRAFT_1211344 [Fomitopsis serialis]|uniref:uncharacterized protein n=1 Tax=Fomitopsis serialis TaxID=139415 RepID=UPI0020085344|nr:uncharacterized protein B0H18DRAFT_1211344 [Neoantrodia serialis]KAH9925783.1 hypothetical protein B0H18DRAFT_1211344 [Neoantrodia serialis]